MLKLAVVLALAASAVLAVTHVPELRRVVATARISVARPQPPRPSPSKSPARPARPGEVHTDEDRAALDRLIVERAGR